MSDRVKILLVVLGVLLGILILTLIVVWPMMMQNLVAFKE